MPTRVIQDDQFVNPLRKRGKSPLRVKVHLFGVHLVANMVDDATGVWAKETEQVAVSIALILHHRRSGILLGTYATQHRTLLNP